MANNKANGSMYDTRLKVPGSTPWPKSSHSLPAGVQDTRGPGTGFGNVKTSRVGDHPMKGNLTANDLDRKGPGGQG